MSKRIGNGNRTKDVALITYLLVLLRMSVNLEQLSTCLHMDVMLLGCIMCEI